MSVSLAEALVQHLSAWSFMPWLIDSGALSHNLALARWV